jgi:hypothetical protein
VRSEHRRSDQPIAIDASIDGSDHLKQGDHVSRRAQRNPFLIKFSAPSGIPSHPLPRFLAIVATLLVLGVSAVARAAPAAFTHPTDGATSVDLSAPFAWTPASDGTAYYLTIGTVAGGRDVLDTGSLSATSYPVPQLPAGEMLHARIYTLIAGSWRYTDAAFTAAAAPRPQLTYPADGAVGVSVLVPFSWSAVAGAQAYYLTIGTTPYGRDVLDTGAISGTSYAVPPLPAGVPLSATLYALSGQRWWSSSTGFVAAAPSLAQLTHPLAGAQGVDPTIPFNWTAVPGATRYYLTVGTSPRARDVYDSGALPASWTSALLGGLLPQGAALSATIYTEVGGHWFPSDATFTVANDAPVFTYPASGATNVDVTRSIAWTTVPGADLYYLTVGTTPGGRDLVDTGTITGTTYFAGTLPQQPLYATVYALKKGFWGGRASPSSLPHPRPSRRSSNPRTGRPASISTPASTGRKPTRARIT